MEKPSKKHESSNMTYEEEEEIQHDISKLRDRVQQNSLSQKVTKAKMDGLKKDIEVKMYGVEAKMDGLKKYVEANVNDLEAKMDGMEAKMDGVEARMDDLKKGVEANMEDLKTNLTKFLQECLLMAKG